MDTDITRCQYEGVEDLENSCGHGNDVGIRCYDVSWSGIRLGVSQNISTLKHVYIEKAGLLDPTTNQFKSGSYRHG